MKSTNYSEKVMDHFRNPRNTGTLKGDNVAMGRVGNPVCGDLMDIYIRVEDNIIKDIKFQTFGCGSAVATSSMITEMVKGKTLEEAEKVTRKDVADELDGLPAIKMHCSNLAADALKEAIKNYRAGQRVGDVDVAPPEVAPKGCSTVEVPDSVLYIKNEEKYRGNGVYNEIKDYSEFDNLRTLIIENGDKTLEIALELIKHTPRVILTTEGKELSSPNPDLRKKVKYSDIKILTQARVLEIGGEGEVEKAVLLNLDEDEKFELFIDAIVIIS